MVRWEIVPPPTAWQQIKEAIIVNGKIALGFMMVAGVAGFISGLIFKKSAMTTCSYTECAAIGGFCAALGGAACHWTYGQFVESTMVKFSDSTKDNIRVAASWVCALTTGIAAGFGTSKLQDHKWTPASRILVDSAANQGR